MVEGIAGLTLLGWYRPKVRVGVATGLVIVGEIFGGLGRSEPMLAGESANLAARLMSVADPNTVLISSTTQQLAAGFFEYEEPFKLSLKGFPSPILAWRPLRTSNAEGRFQALRADNLTPFVGRDREVETLLGLWDHARSGVGQVALISGEPGIGKSRLAIELQQRLRTRNHFGVRYFCSPQHDASPLHPIKETMERRAGFEPCDPLSVRLAKLNAMLAPFLDDPRVDPSLIAELLSLPSEPDPRLDAATPQRRKELTLIALLAIIEALAKRQPLLLCFEDAHWSDPTSLELLGLLVARVPQISVLALVTARPEFVAEWRNHPGITSLVLARLNTEAAARMIELLPGVALIGASLRRDILARADGVPLFLEELTKTVLSPASRQAAEKEQGPIEPFRLRCTRPCSRAWIDWGRFAKLRRPPPQSAAIFPSPS